MVLEQTKVKKNNCCARIAPHSWKNTTVDSNDSKRRIAKTRQLILIS